jgi:DNA processing protein
MIEREYLIALYSFLAFGPVRTGLLINYFGSSKKVWKATTTELSKVGLSSKTVKEFEIYRKNFNFEHYFSNLKKYSIDVLTKDDKTYPINLKELSDAPFVLYVRGKLKDSDVNSVAIVGSRKMTSYGKEVTTKLASELGRLGLTIVSGLAFGVDLVAHISCLETGGRCIAVLAGGVDKITPRTNEWLGRKIIGAGGAVISEFPPGTTPQRHFFPFRNRIISGMSRGVIVVEGAIKSGTIHTANHAANQGRTVFAVPGPITSPMSQAPLYLIKNGAKMLTGVTDILEELDIQTRVDQKVVEKVLPSGKSEEKLYELLQKEPHHIDELARITGLTVPEISASLTVMELKGLVKNVGRGIYKCI